MADADFLSPTDIADLELSRDVRRRMIRQLTKPGVCPKDPDKQRLLISAMEGLDRSVLTQARIGAQRDSDQEKTRTAQLIGQVLLTARQQLKAVAAERALRVDHPIEDVLPGEMEQGTQSLDPQTFLQRPAVSGR